MSIPCTSFSPDPANLAVGTPALQDAEGSTGLSGFPSATKERSASFDSVLAQVDDPAESDESDKPSTSADASPLTPEQMAMMVSMVMPSPLVLPPTPLQPQVEDSSASSLTLVGAEGRSIPELLVRGTEVLEYQVSPAPAEAANKPAETDFAPLQGKTPLQPTRGIVPSAQTQLAAASPAAPTDLPSSSNKPSPSSAVADPDLTQVLVPEANETSGDKSSAQDVFPSPSIAPVNTATLTRAQMNRSWAGRAYGLGAGKGPVGMGGPARTPSLPSPAPLPGGPSLLPTPNLPVTTALPAFGTLTQAQPIAPSSTPDRTQAMDTAPTETPAAEVADPNAVVAPLAQAAGQANSPAAAASGNLPSHKNTPSGRSEKSAGSVVSGRSPGVKPSTSRGKNVPLDVDQEALDKEATEVGTNAANWGKTMYQETRNFPSAPGQGDALSFGSLMRNGTGTTVEDLKTVAPSHATDLVHEIREIADGLWAVERNSVEVKFNFGEQERLSVRVEYRDGTVQATFRTDSADVRDAISREWQAQGVTPEHRSYRVADPIFAAPTSSFSAGGDASRQQRSPEQQQQPSSGLFERFPLSNGSRSAQSITTSSPLSSASPRETNGRLHALV